MRRKFARSNRSALRMSRLKRLKSRLRTSSLKRGEWEPDKYHDTFQDNLKKLIEAKLEGGEIQAVEQPKKLAPVLDLMAALKESLAQTKKPAASEKVAEMPAKSQQKARRVRG